MSVAFSDVRNIHATTSTMFAMLPEMVGSGSTGDTIRTESSSFKNMVINGEFLVDQRLERVAKTISGNATQTGPDRFLVPLSSTATLSVQTLRNAQEEIEATGHEYSLKLTKTSTAVTSYAGITHPIEGIFSAPLLWGSSTGKRVALSFWFKSNVTGTHSVAISNNTTYSYVATFSVPTADRWIQAKISIPAPPSGTSWASGRALGVRLDFCLYNAAKATGTTSAWLSGMYTCHNGFPSSLWASQGDYIQITGVQFEATSSATSFEYRDYKTELKYCQRYFEKSQGIGVAMYMFGDTSASKIWFLTYKRDAPSSVVVSNAVTDNGYTSSLVSAVHADINGFGVKTTDTQMNNVVINFGWTADAEMSV